MELVIVAMVLTTASLIGAFFLGNRFVNSSRYRYVAESRVTGRFTQGVSPLGISLELALLAFIGSRESVLTTGWLVGLGIVWSLLWGGALAFVRDADFLALEQAETPVVVPRKTRRAAYRNWFIFGTASALIAAFASRGYFRPAAAHGVDPLSSLTALGIFAIWAGVVALGMWFELSAIRKRLTGKPDQNS